MTCCEFCENPSVRKFTPHSEAIRAIWGERYACERHFHWVRRLAHLDLGNVVIVETQVGQPTLYTAFAKVCNHPQCAEHGACLEQRK